MTEQQIGPPLRFKPVNKVSGRWQGMPVRIQRKYGVPLPENTVYVGWPTKWANPYQERSILSPEKELDYFRHHLSLPTGAQWPYNHGTKEELRGKNLACWCKPGSTCHADVLLEWANGESPEGAGG